MEREIPEPTVPVQEILALLWRRRALVALVSAVGLATAVVLTWLQAPTYRATAKLMVTSARATITVSPDANERPRVDPVTDADLGAEVALLSSRSLLREVLEPLAAARAAAPAAAGFGARVWRVLRYPLAIPGRLYRSLHALPPPSALDLWLDDVRRRLSVDTVGHSNLIEVAFEDSRPRRAAELVNSLVSLHVERHVRRNQEASAEQFYEAQGRRLAEKLNEAEGALHAFYDREGLGGEGEGLPALRQRVSHLETDLADGRTALAESSAEADYLARALQGLPREGVAPAPGLRTSPGDVVQARLLELELERSQLLTQYAPTSVKVADIDRRIAEARRLLAGQQERGMLPADPVHQAITANLTQTRARAAALQARIDAVGAQLEAARPQLQHLEAIASEQDRLEQEVSAAKQSLATYLKKEEEARFSKAMDESRIVNVTVVERASVPESPQPSKRAVTILLGAVVSLAAGLGLAFARDLLDGTIKSSSEARRLAGVPVIAEIPS